ncbi:MAG: tRNA (adenosine(37)-N6)-threonylcarbamoyltransferase complex ATPase subunit type 1 TsaE [Candidatus Staskawiczbacteria bacterium]|nr:tRNA (adenosine(37)-N6)-threonylcarbamoyltransferase complex ATPase subunit type 1 TsaE [Candidatus Staskawiczbacteria bacterium]
MEKYITNNNKETQSIGENFAQEILATKLQKNAVVLALSGDLGAGKTTFLQGFAKGLGIEEVVNSPTFIIMKKFEIKKSDFKFFYHFDLYRLENQTDVEFLDLAEIISDPKNIVAVEWPEKIKKIMPENVISITFKHLEPASAKGSGETGENKRELTISK